MEICEVIEKIEKDLLPYLDNLQLQHLHESLVNHLPISERKAQDSSDKELNNSTFA